MGLDTPVQLDQRLQLSRVERAELLGLETTLEGSTCETSHDFAEVSRELVPQTVVDVQLALTGRSEVRLIDEERLMDESLVMLLHSELPWRVRVPDLRWLSTCGGRTRIGGESGRGDVELAPEVLDLEVEQQIPLTEVIPKELVEEVTKWWLVDDEAKTLGVGLLGVAVVGVHLLCQEMRQWSLAYVRAGAPESLVTSIDERSAAVRLAVELLGESR